MRYCAGCWAQLDEGDPELCERCDLHWYDEPHPLDVPICGIEPDLWWQEANAYAGEGDDR